MKRYYILLIIIIACITFHAQTHMRIHHKEGGHYNKGNATTVIWLPPEKSYICSDKYYSVYTDGVKNDNSKELKGIGEYTTYILQYNAESKLTMVYKMVIY